MQKLLFVLPPLLFLTLLPQEPTAPSAQTAPAAQTEASRTGCASRPGCAFRPDCASRTGCTCASAAVPQNNPVKSTPESQAHALATYKIDCAMCHGENGNGKGDLVADMGLTMKDMRDPATLQNMSDRDIYMLIHDGKGEITAEGDPHKDGTRCGTW